MSQQYLRRSVAIGEAQARALDAACIARGTTRAALIRDAIHEFLERPSGSPDNDKRTAMLVEFTQYAVDVLIRTQAPERREEILTTVQDRMERYHS